MFRNVTILRGFLRFTAGSKPYNLMSCVGYKSQYSIDKLYPNSNLNYGSESSSAEKDPNDEFSGCIPIDQVDVSYCRSSGPGGQHVNKAETKVQVKFNIEKADWIPSWIKPRLFEKERGRITKGGVFMVTSDRTRKQILNQADCFDKIRQAIREAAIRPAEPSEEDVALKNRRLAKAKQRTLKEKKLHSLKKQSRQAPGVGGV
ncbi:large ribosomal subunit protein mL62-like isoform X2 [Lineus longissimus]|uniref:large ribosomal subunit protein mL62-like isoform X2 n=1 Tax=Lineus longissimus TaxID=88925 RepID=UPI00315D0778